MDHADSADSKAGSHIRLVCRTLGLGGMLHWHDDWRCKICLFSCVRVRAKWIGVAKPQTRKGAFLWCVNSAC